MRNISAASLAKLSQKTGTEPVCLVEMQWTYGAVLLYSDKDVGIPGVDGRIISISEFDDVLNFGKNGTSQSATVVMDDTDGAMKEIFNNADIHRRTANVYQWFTGLPISEKFLLFSGVVASPVIWKEGDRTLTFTIMSKTFSEEVGFSPEEGQFPNLPEGMVGQVWPLVFGTVMKLPLMRIDDIPHKERTGTAAKSTTTTDHGLRDPSIAPHLASEAAQAGAATQLAQFYFLAYLEASFTAREKGELDEFDDISKGKGTFSSLAKQYLAQGNKFLLQSQQIRRKAQTLTTVQNKQKSFEKQQIGVTNGQLFRQGQSLNVRIGSGVYTGNFVGDQFNITNVQHPAAEKYQGAESPPPGGTDPALYLDRDNFFWTPAGQQLALAVIAGDAPDQMEDIRYIVAATLPVTVELVYAWQTMGGVKQITIVPPNLYSVIQVNFGTLPITMIDVPYSLSSLTDADGVTLGWEDELFATVVNPSVGPNTVGIIEWLIDTYTNNSWDEASFDQVRALVDPYPMNFALISRPNAISLIQDIAYQARCIIWLKNDVFFIKYLSVSDPPIASLSEVDILEQSLEVSYTETEDLTTKVKAPWKTDYSMRSPNMVILRYHINLYGMQEVTKDYFTYNQQQLVEKSAVFWLIRDSNTFKIVTCKVPIKYLNIETLDTVTLAFANSFIALVPVDCVVQSAVLSTADYTITLQLWVPVRAGEMYPYAFAFPGDLSIQEFWPTPEDVIAGNVGSPNIEPNKAVTMPQTGSAVINKPMSGDTGNGGQLHVTQRPLTWGPDPSYFPDTGNVSPEITQRIDNTMIPGQIGKKPDGTTNYQLYKSNVQDVNIASNEVTTMFPAIVVSGGPNVGPYTINVFQQGLDGDPTVIKTAEQLQINEDDTVPPGTYCFANKVVFTGKDKKVQVKWYFQVPVWVKAVPPGP